jgi:hypothetical protein
MISSTIYRGGYPNRCDDHSIPDKRRILTIEIAITALAAVRSITNTACLIIVVYMGVEFD